jgi:hypothetical protein
VILDRSKAMSPDQGVALVKSLTALTDADKKRLIDTISPQLRRGEAAEGRAQMARI